jgi:two-component system, NtrC family, response regulator HydG
MAKQGETKIIKMVLSSDIEKILVVDDSPDTLDVIQRNLASEGYRVFTAPGVAEAVNILQETAIDLVITDYKMPGISGIDLVRHVRENFRDTEVIMITGYPTIDGAVQAVKIGAEAYLPKPFTDEELLSTVRRALGKLALRRIGQKVRETSSLSPHGIIGASKAMRKVLAAVVKVASSSATVLITGESGTGKELVARAIHYKSPRASGPFVPVNCGGIPEGLLESELFGHVKGAFTGATGARAGFFHAAEKGSLFLDEVSETSPYMQVKLLRALQEKEVCMVGSSRPRKVDVRFLAATNKDLHTLVKSGAFREDLFYRLDVITINIPPLRERVDDIILVAGHFAARFAAEIGRRTPRFSDEALRVLQNYYWPGNVRELENVVQHLVVMTDGDVIDVPELPALMRFSALRSPKFSMTLSEMEADYIRNVLVKMNGNITRAARVLGIDRKTLRAKLKRTDH